MAIGKARFITLEGADGTGKSTQCRLLVEYLQKKGHQVITTHEPYGKLREILLSQKWEPMSEALLMTAARIQHVAELILPALQKGQWVVCDRFLDSTLAYQGSARGLGIERMEALQEGILRPDLTLWLSLPVEISLRRLQERKKEQNHNHFDLEPIAFHEKVAKGFSECAARAAERFHIINADASEKEVWERIEKIMRQFEEKK
ncbi:MAG: dTMP kinase [Parvibaculales bacterium]